MKKILSLMIMLLVVPFVVGQTQIDRSLLQELKYIRNESMGMCEKSIVDYRAECVREIEDQTENIKGQIDNLMKKQRFILMVAVTISAFIGSLSAIAIWQLLSRKFNLI